MFKNVQHSSGVNYIRALSLVGLLGLMVVLPVVGAVMVGVWLDTRLNGHGLVIAGAIIIGVITGFYGAYKLIMKDLPWNH